MKKALVVVESPTKVKTLNKYLGRNYTVKASVGHIMDLPKSRLGVDVKDDFQPEYVVIKGKSKVLKEIREAAGKVDTIYLAPDPDREGEAIAWHIANELKAPRKKPKVSAKIFRILIEEITKQGVSRALENPDELNLLKFESQQARRILDRLVGYQISPLLWDKVRRGLSAGRVQSVALRIIVEREREVEAFVPEEYWTVEVKAHAKMPPPLLLRLLSESGKKLKISDEKTARKIEPEVTSMVV